MVDLDLRGVPCPLNYIRAKLRLERLSPGGRLQVWLDGGEPVEQVPHSLSVAGHTVLKLSPQEEGGFLLLVERGLTPGESGSL